jgi:hypothetical protein
MEKESIPLMIVIIIFLLCFSLCIVGCVSDSSPSATTDNPLSTATLSGKSTALKIGDTAVLDFNGMKKSVRIVSFDQKNGYLTIESTNVGNETITIGGSAWLVDWEGTKHPLSSSGGGTDAFYPGDSRSATWSIFDAQISGLDTAGREKVMKGPLLLYSSLGDSEASWILKES